LRKLGPRSLGPQPPALCHRSTRVLEGKIRTCQREWGSLIPEKETEREVKRYRGPTTTRRRRRRRRRRKKKKKLRRQI